jgi:hypothetical protein
MFAAVWRNASVVASVKPKHYSIPSRSCLWFVRTSRDPSVAPLLVDTLWRTIRGPPLSGDHE